MKVFRVKSPRWFTIAVIIYNLLPIAICLIFLEAFQRGDLTLFLNVYYGIDIIWTIAFLRNKAILFSDHFVYYSWIKREIVYIKDVSNIQVMLGQDKRECSVVKTFDGRRIEMPLKNNALFARYIRSYMQNQKAQNKGK